MTASSGESREVFMQLCACVAVEYAWHDFPVLFVSFYENVFIYFWVYSQSFFSELCTCFMSAPFSLLFPLNASANILVPLRSETVKPPQLLWWHTPCALLCWTPTSFRLFLYCTLFSFFYDAIAFWKLFFTMLFKFSVLNAWNLMMCIFFSFPPLLLLFQSIISPLLSAPPAPSCVAQSLLVPGKSPSRYGRRGSAIGIGTIEEVHVHSPLFTIFVFFY